MTTYLVTGATGFVGSSLLRALLAGTNNHVRVLVRDAAAAQAWREQHATATAQAEPMIASLGDPNAIAKAAEAVEVLFHCAGESNSHAPRSAFAWLNVAATENVLNAARHAGVRRVVHVSCADATLANRDRLNWKETQTLLGPALDEQARSKLLAEELALGSSDRTLQVTALRPAWIWGPGERQLLPQLCAQALAGQRFDLCGGGENLVAALYIDNFIPPLMAAADAPDAPGRAYHLADTEVWTASELYGQLCTALGLPAPRRGVYALSYTAASLRERLNQPGVWRSDVVRRGRGCLLDGFAAVRDLGFAPAVTTEQGMQALRAWAKQVGGPAGIARTARAPTTQRDIDALMHT